MEIVQLAAEQASWQDPETIIGAGVVAFAALLLVLLSMVKRKK